METLKCKLEAISCMVGGTSHKVICRKAKNSNTWAYLDGIAVASTLPCLLREEVDCPASWYWDRA